MRTFLLLLALFQALGCGSGEPNAGPSRKITWDEYQKLDAIEKDDPYVLNNLDADALKKRDEWLKKRRR